MNFIKKILGPFRYFFTKLFVDPSLLNSHINNRIWHETNAFRWAAAYIIKNQIEGDYLEFGVWKGNSFIESYSQIKEYSQMFYSPNSTLAKGNKLVKNQFFDMRFHAFDSFEGLSESNNGNEPIQYFPGNYQADKETFIDRITNAGLDLEKVTVTQGWFDKTLNSKTAEAIDLKKVSISYIDCDLYEPALQALRFITPYLQNGTVLVFDDWFRNKGNPEDGVQGATILWLRENENINLQHFYNADTRTAVFIVQKNSSKYDAKINSV